MVFSQDDGVLIKVLRQDKGYNVWTLLSEFPHKNWSRPALYRLIAQIDASGSAGGNSAVAVVGQGEAMPILPMWRSLCWARKMHRALTRQSDRFHVQQTFPSRLSIVSFTGTYDLPASRKKSARTDCCKQDNTPCPCQAAAEKISCICGQLHMVHGWKAIHSCSAYQPAEWRIVRTTRNQKEVAVSGQIVAQTFKRSNAHFSKSVMASVGVSALGCAELIFIEPGVKINGAYYRDELLTKHLLPAIKELSGDYFTFQQDSAPAHRARETVELLTRETPDFITPLLWPPNSPDLNPVDYKVWSVLQERVYRSPIRDVQHLKMRLVEEWSQFSQNIVDAAVRQWRAQLRACVKADGGHFEYQLS